MNGIALHGGFIPYDDLAGQYIGHAAPKTKEILKRAMEGVLFIDEAYYLHRAENERDYGQEAIEILLQVMENQRDDLVVVLAGYADRMDKFFSTNQRFRSRIAHHIDFPDYSDQELLDIGGKMLSQQNYHLSTDARQALADYVTKRRSQPLFANSTGPLTASELSEIAAADILASRVFEMQEDGPKAAAVCAASNSGGASA